MAKDGKKDDKREQKKKKMPFEPLIATPPEVVETTLREKSVQVAGTMDFERRSVRERGGSAGESGPADEKAPKKKAARGKKPPATPELPPVPPIGLPPVETTDPREVERRKTSMKTQKISEDVLLKLEILDPFLRAVEDQSGMGNISINDKLELIVNSYVDAKLSQRQREAFRAIYETYGDS